MILVATGLHLHLGAPGRRVNAIENHFHQQMVIWRSLSPSILARVLELAARRLVRVPGPSVQQQDRGLRLVEDAAPGTETARIGRAIRPG
jgi:hypothetical protein